MVEVDVPEREGGACPCCGRDLKLVYPTHGIRYWTCPAEHMLPVTQVGPEVVGWAAALVSVQITDGEYTPLSQFDADATDPAQFVDRLVERIEVNRSSCREHERDRRIEGGNDSAGDDEQASLAGGWP